jgi:hypothetical protein
MPGAEPPLADAGVTSAAKPNIDRMMAIKFENKMAHSAMALLLRLIRLNNNGRSDAIHIG